MDDRQRDMAYVLRAVQRAASVAKVSVGPGDAMTSFDAFIKQINREAAAINADATEIEAGKAENRWPVPLDGGEAEDAIEAACDADPSLLPLVSGLRAESYLCWCRRIVALMILDGDGPLDRDWYTLPANVRDWAEETR